MRKVPFDLFKKLKRRFDSITALHDLKYEIVPYFISSHPGCTGDDMKRSCHRGEKPWYQAGAGSGFYTYTHDIYQL